MQKEITLILSPYEASSGDLYITQVARKLSVQVNQINHIRILRRSVDARSGKVKVNLGLLVFIDEMPVDEAESYHFDYPDVSNKEEIIIVGAGPAGLFAALRLIELGFKPVIYERGREVSDRKRDIAQLNRNISLNPDSNYCFGEGGAGTFSDGKLYTRSKKRGDNKKVLQIFHLMGAGENILYEAHPHIGTDKLPKIIVNIRETILQAGGEIYFNTRVTDLMVDSNQVKGIVAGSVRRNARAVILATGHSARDIYELLEHRNILLEAKPFAMGVRVEHPQPLIDNIQYHGQRNQYLPAASYNLVTQVNDRGVYSFCMCPGGFIVPSATSPDETVVNGMSPSQRNSPYANSGIVVEIRLEDLMDFQQYGTLAGLKFQQQFEQLAFNNGGKGQIAPAQRLLDFVRQRPSSMLPKTSYFPGVASSSLHNWIPASISNRLRKGFIRFDQLMKGFLTNEAVIVGVESRTSSPVRIPRNKDTFEHVQVKGLFPCGEGAGYSGGIVSSAVDGDLCATRIAELL